MILQTPINYQNEHGRLRAVEANKRAQRRGRRAYLSATDWPYVLALWGERCSYCGISADDLGERLTCDHFYPLSDEHSPGSVIENLVPACKTCNRTKGDSDPFVWLVARHGQVAGLKRARAIVHHLVIARRWKVEQKRQRKVERKA